MGNSGCTQVLSFPVFYSKGDCVKKAALALLLACALPVLAAPAPAKKAAGKEKK